MIGTYGELWATDVKNDVLVQFQYNIADYDVTSTTSGSGSVAQANNMAVLSTGTTSSSLAEIVSTGKLRYRPGHTAIANFSALWANGGVAGYRQRIGPYNDTDGFYIGYNGTDRVIGFLNGGVATEYTSDTWNGADFSSVDWTQLNVFRIKFGWLGVAPVVFEVMKPGTNEYITLHSIQLQSVRAEPHVGNPALPIHMDVEDTAGTGTTDVIMKTGSWQCGVMGLCATCGNRPFADEQSVTLTTGGAEQSIVNYQSVSTYQGKINKVRSKLLRYQFHVDPPASANDFGTVIFRFRRVQSVGGTPVWTNINANNSVIQYDTAGTYNATGAILGLSEYTGYAGGKGSTVPSQSVDADQFGLFLDPGGIYSLTAQCVAVGGADTPTVRISINWVDLF